MNIKYNKALWLIIILAIVMMIPFLGLTGYKDLDTIFHTDQGSVYSSVSFNNILNSYTITRSMSRAGTPTDNPVIESKNGWLKKEMYIDFDINNYNTVQ